MSSGMDSSILDTYLYEENNLLDQLDEMLVADDCTRRHLESTLYRGGSIRIIFP